MKLAVLGTDADVLALVEAAIAAGHAVVWLGDVRPEDAAALSRLLPGQRASDDWESIMDPALVDAVLVGRGSATDALRAEQLKRLVTDAMPTLVVHPIGTSVLAYYEIDMGRGESHCVLRHYTPTAGSPALAELARWVQMGTSEIGVVHQVNCQRFADGCERDAVLRHLARDVEVLQMVSGGVRTVSAAGPRSTDATYASLQVQMTGRGTATMRWTVAPAMDEQPRAMLTLIGERGTATLSLLPDTQQLTINVGGREEKREMPPFNSARAAIDALANALPANGTAQSADASTWSAATAALEIVDSIELSLQKGRTIEVHQQRLTEEVAFRGTMAALGCGLLVFGFLILVVVCIVGGLETVVEHPLISAWPLMLLALLTFFLLLQTVPWLANKKQPLASEERTKDSERR